MPPEYEAAYYAQLDATSSSHPDSALAGIQIPTTRLTRRPPSARMSFFDQCK
jgi:hypothetical protein